MILHYFMLAWRSTLKNRFISAINIFGLATGLAAAIFMIIWVQNELSFDTGFANYQRTYQLLGSRNNDATTTWETHSYILGEMTKQESPGIDKLTRVNGFESSRVMKINGRPFYEKKAAYIDESWFHIFDQPLLSGDLNSFFSNPLSIILTKNRAAELFGSDDPLGRTISIDSIEYMVRAIIENNQVNSSFQFNMFLPMKAEFLDPEMKKNALNWSRSPYLTFVTLKSGASPAGVETILTSIFQRNVQGNTKANTLSLLPIKQMHLDRAHNSSEIQKGDKDTVLIFSILAALVLFSACINYVNLTTARAAQRSKEVGIRKLNGAGRVQIFVQFLVESTFITLVSVMLAALIVQLALPLFNELTQKSFTNPFLQGTFWPLVGAVTVLVILLNGVYPALMLSSFHPAKVLRGSGFFKPGNGMLRKALVVVQFSFSIVLLVGTIILSKQLKYISQRDGGFNRSLVFQVALPYAAFENMEASKQEAIMQQMRGSIASDAAIKEVSVATPGIGNTEVFFSGEVDWPGKNSSFEPKVSPFWADEYFLTLFEIGLKEGRWLNNDPSDRKNVVINETAAREFGFSSPVAGQRIIYLRDTGVVVGVVKDLQYKNMRSKIGPQIFKQNYDAGTSNLYVKPGIGRTAEAISAAEKAWNKTLPGYPFTYSFVEDDYAAMYAAELKTAKLINLFGGLAIVISCLGLLGLASFSTSARAKEISIRKILGASVWGIMHLLSKDFTCLILLASLLAFPVAYYYGDKWLQGFAYKISLGWEIFALAATLALLVAVLTISAQVAKAAMSSPVKGVRGE